MNDLYLYIFMVWDDEDSTEIRLEHPTGVNYLAWFLQRTHFPLLMSVTLYRKFKEKCSPSFVGGPPNSLINFIPPKRGAY